MNKPSGFLRSNRGFTLVELVLVIVIMGIMMSIAVPGVRELLAGNRVKSATFDLIASVMFARSEATKRGAIGGVQISLKAPSDDDLSRGWCVLFGTTGGCSLTAPGADVMRLQQPLSSVAFTWITTAGPIVFNSSGRLSSEVRIEVSDLASADYVRCVTIDVSGSAVSKRGHCT